VIRDKGLQIVQARTSSSQYGLYEERREDELSGYRFRGMEVGACKRFF
jgi:hypothetical protein